MAMQLDAVRVFVKVAELSSFTRAAQHLGMSKARVSVLVQELETELGSRLLQRSTRAVRITAEGEQFLRRARRLVAEADELTSMFRAPSTLRGSVRVDLPQSLARTLIIPRVPEFLAAHPGIELLLSTTDRRVDVLREGFDCVLRIGKLADSRLVVRKLGSLPVINCASRGYLAQYGTPHTLADLARHMVVHYSLAFGSDAANFEYQEGGVQRELPMRSLVTVNSSDSYEAACLAGLGIIQAPRTGMLDSLATGALVEVMTNYVAAPMPVSLVHGYTRNTPKHVRVVLSWLSQLLVQHLA